MLDATFGCDWDNYYSFPFLLTFERFTYHGGNQQDIRLRYNQTHKL